jgi:hypothetical protein
MMANLHAAELFLRNLKFVVLFLVSPRRYYDTVIKEPIRRSNLKTGMAFLGGILKTEM